jgi:hypothetical protein
MRASVSFSPRLAERAWDAAGLDFEVGAGKRGCLAAARLRDRLRRDRGSVVSHVPIFRQSAATGRPALGR